jgi:hypothetical protein
MVEIGPVCLPKRDPATDEGVPEIVDPGRRVRAPGEPPQLGADPGEDIVNGAGRQGAAFGRYEEQRAGRCRDMAASQLVVSGQRGDGRRMQRNEPRLGELGLADREHAAHEVQVSTAEPQRLGQAQPGRGNEAEERPVGRGPQRAGRRQAPRRFEQVRELSVGVDVRGEPAVRRAERAALRDRRAGYRAGEVACERADYIQPPGPGERCCTVARPWTHPRMAAMVSGPRCSM